MAKLSAGCLVVRNGAKGREVLLVHPRGATFRRPLFGIPKGIVEEDETLEDAALRETLEETGLKVSVRGDLGTVKQASGKIVQAYWATVAPESEAAIDARGRCHGRDGENDVCGFYPLDAAREMMIVAQREFLDRLPAADQD